MALIKTVEYKGITLNDAYHRVSNVNIYKTNLPEVKDIEGTVTEEARRALVVNATVCMSSTAHGEPLDSFPLPQFEYDISGDNAIIQVYAYMKTLPGYEDATDA